MTDDIEIRQAVAADCDVILAMLVQLARELGDSDSFKCRLEDIRDHGFGTNPLFRCLIASRQQENVGLALFFPLFSTTRGQPGVYLQDLWISSDCRDAGLGSRLLRQVAISAAQQWHACYLDLMVHGHNQAAERFYRRHGFDERGEDRHLSIDGDKFCRLQQAPG
ncbi:MAG: GNAT family N-acetyltransferase [Gammaproteobacteria bacterium]|jgi:ribosomal protein S18 acetylase RimI-like enzyme|nr:GNAT family N-acetyltransferase [Gammaproteobacteria bacterium]